MLTQNKNVPVPAPNLVLNKRADRPVARHPMIQKAMRDTRYLVWTNIGC